MDLEEITRAIASKKEKQKVLWEELLPLSRRVDEINEERGRVAQELKDLKYSLLNCLGLN